MVQMRKICFLMDSIFSIGGVQRVTAVIAKELAKDHDVTILTFDKPEAENTSLYDLNEAPIRYAFFSYPALGQLHNKICKAYSWFYLKYRLQSKWASKLYGYSSFPRPLRKALTQKLQEGNYDVVIGVHAPLAGRLATMKSHLPRVKTIGWIHNSFEALFGNGSIYIGEARKRHYIYQFRRLDHLVVLCQDDANYYKDYDARCLPTVIYNPLTLIPGTPSEGTSKQFLAVGRFSRHHKGFDLLIEAFRIFAKDNQEWTLDIVGEGVEEPMYRQLIKKHKLEDRITIHPFTNHIQQYYSDAQVYVLSSRWEGMPLVLMEAMSHGLPVISSNLPVCLEIMGDFGMYFTNGDVNGMANRMKEAATMDWREKSRQALQIASRYHIEKIIHQWKQLIDEG